MTGRLEKKGMRRVVRVLDALSFAWFKRRVVRWIGETTCRLNGVSFAWESVRSRALAADKRQTTCRLHSGQTTCRPRPLKQNSHLTERRRFERAKRRRFASNPTAADPPIFLLLRSSFLHFCRTHSLSQLSLTHFSLSSVSFPSPPTRTLAGGKFRLLSPHLFLILATFSHFCAERKFRFLEVFLDEFWLKIYGF